MPIQLFSVLTITSDQFADVEQLGSKEKFWFWNEGQRWLFKEARLIKSPQGIEITGEDWAEKIAAEIAHVLDIPAATVELAEFDGRRGSASLNFTSTAQQLMHGNEVMAGYLDNYNPEVRFKQTSHTVENIIIAIRKMFPQANEHRTVLRQLASYMVLDALIGNTDRHHENWGLLWQVLVEINDFNESARLNKQYDVAPSFDHASSLGRELMDVKRAEVLAMGRIEAYCRRGRGGIYLSDGRKGANPLVLVESTALKHPEYFMPTLDVLRSVPLARLTQLLDQLPHDRASPTACQFAKEMLRIGYESLLRIRR
jgi:hypothetical protein